MKTINAQIEETIQVRKMVKVQVSDDADADDIAQAVRDKAYEKTVQSAFKEHGWEVTGCENVTIMAEGFGIIG